MPKDLDSIVLARVTPSEDQLLALSAKMPDPGAYLETLERYSERRILREEKRAAAFLELKRKDPDEIDRRADSATRRLLQESLAFCAVLCVLGVGLSVCLGAGILVLAVLSGVTVVVVAQLGMLASGEAVTAQAIGSVLEKLRPLSKGVSVSKEPPRE